ncbi:MAG: PDZ domain-containing protein [Dehalococcoidales bacterium]|nr:PDZ domain-containing protein [Dehalococcoidales bacterium]
MNKRYLILSACLAVLLVTAGVFGGYLYGTHKLTKEFDLKDKDLQRVINAWISIQTYHKDNEIMDYRDLAESTIRGMVDGLNDTYADFFSSREEDFGRFLTAGYIGVGYIPEYNDDGSITIVDIYKDCPAAKAGMMVGDVLLSIDGTDVTGKDSDLVHALTDGDEGTHAIFTVLRDGKTIDLDVTRGWVALPSATYFQQDGIGIICISVFNEYTVEEFEDCLRQAESDRVSGIILDLLDNGGGYVSEVIPIASCFLNEGDTLFTFLDHGSAETYTAVKSDLHTDLPVVVLVGDYTASSAEILLCALTENGRAVSVGMTTFGKGTWNKAVDIDDSVLQFTGGTWNTPNGNNITGKGVTPDFEIPLVNNYYEWAVDYLTGTN